MSKPREWIVVFDKPEKLLGGHLPGADDPDEGVFARVHVIEKSAYDELQMASDVLRSLLLATDSQADLLAEALEFIQSRTHRDPLLIEELNVRAARVYEMATKALKEYRGEK